VGKINKGPNGTTLVAQAVNILNDFNELTYHILSVIKLLGTTNQSTRGFDINGKILNYLDNVKDGPEGIHISSLFEKFHELSSDQIKKAVDFLINEGHLYTTIDDKHIRSINKN
jgi:hypothetical protein